MRKDSLEVVNTAPKKTNILINGLCFPNVTTADLDSVAAFVFVV